MGFRTIVILDNDRADEWSTDPDLGAKIANAMNHVNTPAADFYSGKVVENAHADTQSLAVIDSLEYRLLASDYWTSKSGDDDAVTLRLLRRAAAVCGYRLAKIPEILND
jgi:hypothetical protein